MTREILEVVTSADDNYAMPLAVAIRSLLDHASSNKRVRLFVLDGGLSPASKKRCLDSWSGNLESVEWIAPQHPKLRKLRCSDHFTIATYFRILIPDLLPVSSERVVYTDPDVLFRRDVSELFDVELGCHPIAASRDHFSPFVDNRVAMKNYEDAKQVVFGSTAIPVENGIAHDPYQHYFNAGFLVMDLMKFRDENLSERLLDYCTRNRDRLIWADQCALNACLGNRWLQLDPSWNVIPHLFYFPSAKASWCDPITFERIQSDPAMLHFAGRDKPWHYSSRHPYTEEFFAIVDRTQWAGWRPEPTADSICREPKSDWRSRFLSKLGLKFNRRAA